MALYIGNKKVKVNLGGNGYQLHSGKITKIIPFRAVLLEYNIPPSTNTIDITISEDGYEIAKFMDISADSNGEGYYINGDIALNISHIYTNGYWPTWMVDAAECVIEGEFIITSESLNRTFNVSFIGFDNNGNQSARESAMQINLLGEHENNLQTPGSNPEDLSSNIRLYATSYKDLSTSGIDIKLTSNGYDFGSTHIGIGDTDCELVSNDCVIKISKLECIWIGYTGNVDYDNRLDENLYEITGVLTAYPGYGSFSIEGIAEGDILFETVNVSVDNTTITGNIYQDKPYCIHIPYYNSQQKTLSCRWYNPDYRYGTSTEMSKLTLAFTLQDGNNSLSEILYERSDNSLSPTMIRGEYGESDWSVQIDHYEINYTVNESSEFVDMTLQYTVNHLRDLPAITLAVSDNKAAAWQTDSGNWSITIYDPQ